MSDVSNGLVARGGLLRHVTALRNFRIGSRLAVGFSIVLVLLVTTTLAGFLGLGAMYDTADTSLRQDVRMAQHAASISRHVLAERRYEKDMILNLDDAEKVAEYRGKWDAANASLDAELAAAGQLELTDEDKAALEEMQQSHDTYANGLRAMADGLGAALRTAESANEAMGGVKDAVRGLEAASVTLNDRAMARVERVENKLIATRNTTRWVQFGLAALSLALGALLSMLITRSITGPLDNALQVSNAIAGGQFDNTIHVDSTDETGQLLRSLGAMQERLQHSKLDYEGQLQAISQIQAVIEFKPDGTIVTANENLLKVMGYTLEQVRGRHHSMFVDSKEQGSTRYREFWADLGNGKAQSGQFRRVNSRGEDVWIQGVYAPIFGADGKPFKVVKYAVDVSQARKEAVLNAAFRGALDKLDANVIVANRDNEIIFVNPAATQMLGRAQVDMRTELPEFDASRLQGTRLDQITKEPLVLRAELEQLTDTRAREEVIGGRTMKSVLNPMTDDAGRRLGTVVEWFDRTQAVATERELKEIIGAVTAGNLERRISLTGKTGVFETLSQGINELVDTVDVLAREVQALVSTANTGDLTTRIKTEGRAGLLVKLGTGINELTGNMAQVVANVKHAASEVAKGAEEMSQGSMSLSQRTEEQASSLEETASSMEEMTGTVKQNADNARLADELAAAARDQAVAGGAVVSRAVSAMTEINESSKRIANIISVIDEIAFQTNLLALNAAVEAARAGEQGRGFAVVATEVRNLAGRSATAAKEIKALIKDSVHKVEEGSTLVTQSGTTLQEIVLAVKKVSDIVAEIAAASNEQSQGIDQVNKAVMQLDELTQQNAALVEQASASSQSMADQANGLNQSMMRYKVAAADVAAARTEAAAQAAAAPAAPPVERRKASRPWSEGRKPTSQKPAAAKPVAHKIVTAGATPKVDAVWAEF